MQEKTLKLHQIGSTENIVISYHLYFNVAFNHLPRKINSNQKEF